MFLAHQRHHQRHKDSVTTARSKIDTLDFMKIVKLSASSSGTYSIGAVVGRVACQVRMKFQNEIQSCVHYDDESNCETINNERRTTKKCRIKGKIHIEKSMQ